MKTIVIRWKVVLVFEIFFSANCFANGFSGDYSEICSAFEALQKNNSQQTQMQFFKAFPSNWYEFIKTYEPGPASLYKEYDSHLSAFENLNMIDDSVYIERLIYLSLGAMKDADAPALLQNIIRRKMFQSEKMTKRFLHFIEKLQKGHQMQFWQFFWSNLIYDKELEQKYFFLLGLLSENGKRRWFPSHTITSMVELHILMVDLGIPHIKESFNKSDSHVQINSLNRSCMLFTLNRSLKPRKR